TTHSTDAKEPSKGSSWGGDAGSVMAEGYAVDPPRRHTHNARDRLRAHGPARRARAFRSSTSIEPRCRATTPSAANRRSTRLVVGLAAPASSPTASWVRGTTTVPAPSGVS